MNYFVKIFLFHIAIVLLARSESKICETNACKKYSADLSIMMDSNIDPCDDFYSFVCGNFAKLHPIPNGRPSYGTRTHMDTEILRDLTDLLNKETITDLEEPRGKAKAFYQSCLDGKNQQSNPAILQFSNNMSPDNYEDNLRDLMLTGRTSRMFQIIVELNPKDPENLILNIGVPGFILPPEILKNPDSDLTKKKIGKYKKFMNTVSDELGIWGNEKSLFEDIVSLQYKIAKIYPSVADLRDYRKNSNTLKISELQLKCSEISWLNLINGVLRNTEKTVTDDEIVMIFNLNYIDRLCPILKEYKSDENKLNILQKDIEWAAISSLTQYGPENLVKAEAEMTGSTEYLDSTVYCARMTSAILGDVIGHMYIKNFFQKSKKTDIETLLGNMKKVTKSTIENAQWMDSKTKEEALKKLSAMKYKIGYPDDLLSECKLKADIEQVSIDPTKLVENVINYKSFYYTQMMKEANEKVKPDEWPFSVQVVNAGNEPITNSIIFPAGILRYPFYDIELPIHINYGAIGMVLGHEIMHGFDNQGSLLDEKGLRRDWWSPESRARYTEKAECIRQQYGQYSVNGTFLQSNQSLGENIADNAGLKMAYKAAFSEERERQLLPNFNFTSEQQIFVGCATILCTSYTDEGLILAVKSGAHSLQKFRVIGTLSNMPEFSRAFNCDERKKMNPSNKCSIW